MSDIWLAPNISGHVKKCHVRAPEIGCELYKAIGATIAVYSWALERFLKITRAWQPSSTLNQFRRVAIILAPISCLHVSAAMMLNGACQKMIFGNWSTAERCGK